MEKRYEKRKQNTSKRGNEVFLRFPQRPLFGGPGGSGADAGELVQNELHPTGGFLAAGKPREDCEGFCAASAGIRPGLRAKILRVPEPMLSSRKILNAPISPVR